MSANAGCELGAYFRANLAALMGEQKMTHRQLGNLTGLVPAMITFLLDGTRGCNLRTLGLVASALGVSPTALIRPPSAMTCPACKDERHPGWICRYCRVVPALVAPW